MKEIAEKFQKFGVVPVVVLEDTKDAVPLAKALVEGGLPCAEVTFRTEAAEESHGRAVPGNACGSRYRTYNRTGRRGCWRRSKIYRKPGL